MGRIFETRKHKIFARMDKMAKAFTRISREIALAVKQGGPDPNSNPRLRAAIQNSKGVNMPKDKVEAAIKRATSRDEKDFEEVIYEGYGPHGVPVVIECATDNSTRTVANVRLLLSKSGGTLGTKGSLDFMFTRKGVFKIKASDINLDEMELDLIDMGAEEIITEGDEAIIYTKYTDFGLMQKGLEAKDVPVISAQLQRIPNSTKELSDEQMDEVLHLIEKLEEDDDVLAVYHNLQ